MEFAQELTRRNRLEAARDAGINRISLGVQTMNREVLVRVGRPQGGPEVSRRAYEMVREVGFDEVNVDLIFGLEDETRESFWAGLDEVLRWGPETITVQLVHDCVTTRVFRSEEQARGGRESLRGRGDPVGRGGPCHPLRLCLRDPTRSVRVRTTDVAAPVGRVA